MPSRSKEAWRQTNARGGMDAMDWATIRGGAPAYPSQPEETIEAFLVRVGVPPAYRVDCWPAGFAGSLSLEPSFDLAGHAWTWSLSGGAGPDRLHVLKAWPFEAASADRVAAEVLSTAREALLIKPGEPMPLRCTRSGARPFERLGSEPDETFLERAVGTLQGGDWLEVGLEPAPDPLPYARLDVGPSEMTLQWIATLVGGGPARMRIDAWPRRRSVAYRDAVQEVRRTLGATSRRGLSIWRGTVCPRLVDVEGDDVGRVASIIAAPDRWTAGYMESPVLRPWFLPRLGRSGPGSGMDELASSQGDGAAGQQALIHLLWWEGDPADPGTKRSRSWPLTGPSIDEPTAREVGSAVRAALGLDEAAAVRAVALPVGSPDGTVSEDRQDEVMHLSMIMAGLGSVVGAVAALVIGLVKGASAGWLSVAVVFAAGLIVAVVVGFLAAFVVFDAVVWLVMRLTGGPAESAHAYEARWLRAAVAVTSFAMPALTAVAAAALVAGVTSSA